MRKERWRPIKGFEGYYANLLAGCMSYSLVRKRVHITRVAFAKTYDIVGGLRLLTKSVNKLHTPKQITLDVDARFDTVLKPEAAGFTEVAFTKPDYFWESSGIPRAKGKPRPAHKVWYKVYDAGKYTYEWTL